MDDFISRKAAIECAIDAVDDWDGGYNPERERCIREHMAKVPAVDAIPVVHARWSKARFEKTYAGYTKVSIYYICSACGKDVEDALFNYCPKCGARMDGERRDEASCMT